MFAQHSRVVFGVAEPIRRVTVAATLIFKISFNPSQPAAPPLLTICVRTTVQCHFSLPGVSKTKSKAFSTLLEMLKTLIGVSGGDFGVAHEFCTSPAPQARKPCPLTSQPNSTNTYNGKAAQITRGHFGRVDISHLLRTLQRTSICLSRLFGAALSVHSCADAHYVQFWQPIVQAILAYVSFSNEPLPSLPHSFVELSSVASRRR